MSKNTRDQLAAVRQNLIDYLYAKVGSEDWHAVADAAMDLREVDAKLEILEGLQK